MPKHSKTDTAQEDPNSNNDENEDEGADDKPKKAPAKGKGAARVKKTRCMALPFPPCIS